MKQETVKNCKILVGCFVIQLLIAGAGRLSSIYFVETITRYNVDRKQASFPYILAYLVKNLSGPLVGYIEQIIGTKWIIFIGCLMSTFSIGCCFFAEDILTVTILWGVILGLSFGLAFNMQAPLLSQHFHRNKNKANAFVLVGSSIGGILLPVIATNFIQTFGTSGSFLVLSAIIAHSIPASLLLENPNINTKHNLKENADLFNKNDNKNKRTLLIFPNHDDSLSGEQPIKSISRSSTVSVPYENQKISNKSAGVLIRNNINNKTLAIISNNNDSLYIKQPKKSVSRSSVSESYENLNTLKENTYAFNINNDKTIAIIPDSDDSLRVEQPRKNLSDSSLERLSNENLNITISHSKNSQDKRLEFSANNSPSTTFMLKVANIGKNLDTSSNRKKFTLRNFRIFIDPTFIVILIINGININVIIVVWTIILDFVRDKNVPENLEIYYVILLPITDIIGRLVSGYISDKNFLSFSSWCFITFLIKAITLTAIVHVNNFILLMVFEILLSICIGITIVLQVTMTDDFMEEDLKKMSQSCRVMLYAPLSLTVSPMLGYFRGGYGSYDNVFYILSGASLFCGCCACLLPYISKKKLHVANSI